MIKNTSAFIAILLILLSTNSFSQDSLDAFIDDRDGKTYKTVKIGDQIWMAQNLAFKAKTGCWVFNNKSCFVDTHGYLYSWETAKKVCPVGWHLPSQSEYETLLNNSGGEGINAYNTLRDTTKNSFCAVLGGWRSNYGAFNYIDYYGGYWTSSESDKETAMYMSITSHNTRAYMRNFDLKKQGFTVRCLQD